MSGRRRSVPTGAMREHGGPFGPAELAWQYRREADELLCALHLGCAAARERQHAGRAGTGGELLEVTRAGDIVWEYRSPFSGQRAQRGRQHAAAGHRRANPFALFRATRISADHPGLAGRTLRPLDPQPARFDWSEGALMELRGGLALGGEHGARRCRRSCSTRCASRSAARCRVRRSSSLAPR